MRIDWDLKHKPKSRHPVDRLVDWLDSLLTRWEKRLRDR